MGCIIKEHPLLSNPHLKPLLSENMTHNNHIHLLIHANVNIIKDFSMPFKIIISVPVADLPED